MMRSSVLFFLGVSFAVFGFGLSLQCYSCPDGSSSGCKVKRECDQSEDTCLKLTSGEMTYTECMAYTDCNFGSLSFRYILPEFSFSCCQSNLCNGKSFLEKMKDFFG